MILIDTNVISGLWMAESNPDVLARIDAQTIDTLYLPTITVAELRSGLATMPKGKHHTIYQERLEKEVLPIFTDRVLPFDLDASQAYAELMARTRTGGKAIGKADGYIAATSITCGLMVATRDTGPFEAAGLNIINPWKVRSVEV